ncbi:aspartate/glutamate racemase family protein [Pelagibacterales bacterium SAG-MED20]|nr:aspartate/glutamate racemase family protein [Pelagibacterales bacterium SAG-MED20]
MKLDKIKPKFINKSNPRIGLITLGSDFRIEKDFNNVIYGKNIDLFVNRIHCYNPLTNETLAKMADDITKVTKEILPGEKLDCVAYGCTSGTIAAGYDSIERKINLAKPKTKVTTPITSAIKILEKLNIKKISVFTPYTQEINTSIIDYFKKYGINVKTLHYFDIASDIDIGKVDGNYLFDVLSNLNLDDSEALFISCTALPALDLIDKLEKKFNKIILSSNQTLIWEALNLVGNKEIIKGYGKIFELH